MRTKIFSVILIATTLLATSLSQTKAQTPACDSTPAARVQL